MRQRILAGIILSLTAAISTAASISGQGTWETTLQGRLPVTPGGTNYRAYYDTDLNITWLADANLAPTNTFGLDGITLGGVTFQVGTMTWNTAQFWIGAVNSAKYLGVSDWRLPTVTDTGALGCGVTGYSGTDCGYNVNPSTGEMAHLFYNTLGNSAGYNTSRVQQPCYTAPPDYCLTNTGPFSNFEASAYWSGTQSALSNVSAWTFSFFFGLQSPVGKTNTLRAWPVIDGDPFSPVPIPAAVWLLGSALGVLGWARQRVRRN